MVSSIRTWTSKSWNELAEALAGRNLIVVPPQAGGRVTAISDSPWQFVPGAGILPQPATPGDRQTGFERFLHAALRPLFHTIFERPRFEPVDWQHFRDSNAAWAASVLDVVGGRPDVVLLADHRLSLLPEILKARNPALTVAQFWDIPWPGPDLLRRFPWRGDLLRGLLGNDLIGFQHREHAANFLRTVQDYDAEPRDSECEPAAKNRRRTQVRELPAGIDFEGHVRLARNVEVSGATSTWWVEIGRVPEFVGIGIDEADSVKGIPERLDALDRLFETHPEYLGRLTFLQVLLAGSARSDELERRIGARVDAMNRRWARGVWQPVLLVRRQLNQEAIIALHLMADFCVVSSLDEGMSLAAKEFVASRFDGDGVLILSSFSGAAGELAGAVLINPLDTAELSAAMHQAVTMPAPERRSRMNRMRAAVAGNSALAWVGSFLSAVLELPSQTDKTHPQPAGVLRSHMPDDGGPGEVH